MYILTSKLTGPKVAMTCEISSPETLLLVPICSLACSPAKKKTFISFTNNLYYFEVRS